MVNFYMFKMANSKPDQAPGHPNIQDSIRIAGRQRKNVVPALAWECGLDILRTVVGLHCLWTGELLSLLGVVLIIGAIFRFTQSVRCFIAVKQQYGFITSACIVQTYGGICNLLIGDRSYSGYALASFSRIWPVAGKASPMSVIYCDVITDQPIAACIDNVFCTLDATPATNAMQLVVEPKTIAEYNWLIDLYLSRGKLHGADELSRRMLIAVEESDEWE